jgi:hypothetical protein
MDSWFVLGRGGPICKSGSFVSLRTLGGKYLDVVFAWYIFEHILYVYANWHLVCAYTFNANFQNVWRILTGIQSEEII